MGPKPKKSKEEIAAEKAAKEEEERIAAEKEKARLAAVAEADRVEANRIQGVREEARQAELVRLGKSHEEYAAGLKVRMEQLAVDNAIVDGENDWEKFKDPTSEPDPYVEKDMNTFITLTNQVKVSEIDETLSVLKNVIAVANSVDNVWSDSLEKQDFKTLSITNKYVEELSGTILDKIDAATAHYLRFVDNHLNDRTEIQVEEVADGVTFGMWGSLSEMRPIRKSIQLEKMGIQLDLPKQVLQLSPLVHRVARLPLDYLSQSVYNSPDAPTQTKQVLGDLFYLDILIPPPQAFEIRAKRWIVRDKPKEGSPLLKKSTYPSSIGTRCFIKVPDDVIMSDDVRVMLLDEKTREWTDEGISDYQYSEVGRLAQFMMTTVGTVALVKDRIVDFPYKSWSLSAVRTISPGKNPFLGQECKFTLQTARFDIVIDVQGRQCSLGNAFTSSVQHLVGVKMAPGVLLSQLQKLGVNLLPSDGDIPRVENNGMSKNSALALDTLREMARCASSFDFKSSKWNKDGLAPYQIGLLARESTVYTASKETFDYECIFIEEDSSCQSYKYAPNFGTVKGTGPSGARYTNVLGYQYNTKPGFNHTARPGEEAHIELIKALESRSTPEAVARAMGCKELFQGTVYKLLRLMRPLTLTFDESV